MKRHTISSNVRLFVVLITVVILITDMISLWSRIDRTIRVSSESISQLLSEANFQESAIRMRQMNLAMAGNSVSMEAIGLPGVPIEGAAPGATTVAYMVKRVVVPKDSLSAEGSLEQLINGEAKGDNLTDKLGTVLNRAVNIRDLNFAKFDSLLVSSLRTKKLYSRHELSLNSQKDTLAVYGYAASKNFHKSIFNKTFKYPLNPDGTAWYEYTAFIPEVVFKQDDYFILSDLFFGLVTLILLFGLYYLFLASDEIDKRSEEFLHMLTHDMKSPVSVIKLASGALSENCNCSAHSENAEYLSMIERNCNLLQEKIETIIPLTDRLKAGVKNLTDINLSSFVSHLAGGISLKSEGDSVDVEIPSDIKVKADPDLLDIIFRNLIENALKYGPADGPTKVVVTADIKNGSSCVATVSDNGIGISKADIPLIFNKFYKANRAKTTASKSFGLGLYSVKECVEMLGWKIGVTSVLGKGSSFNITIPDISLN